ncbi:MAG: ATP-dependent DNA ligase [Candidatus Hadarchaeota archaeon]
MEYRRFAEACQNLEETSSYLQKNSIISGLLSKTPSQDLEMVVTMILGRIFPAHVSRETGIGLQQLKKAVGRSTGYSQSKIEELMEELGDLGKVAEKLIMNKKQMTFADEDLTVEKVYESLRSLPEITGDGSVDRKISTISELLTSASPLEGKFIVRTILGDLRIGVAEGRLRDSIAEAFDVSPESVEHAYMLTTDYGKVAKAAAEGGEKGLSELDLSVGHPVNPMLAQRAENIEEIMRRMEGRAAFEIKLDGIRIQPHKKGDQVFLFTRRMENYTDMFPELKSEILSSIVPDEAIVDGELVAIDKKTGEPMPFQEVLRRRRKYDIEKTAEEIPVQVYLFDVLLSGHLTMIGEPYGERRNELRKIVDSSDKVRVVESKILDSVEDVIEFRDLAVSEGHEGLLAKDLESMYRAGKREFSWLKLKAEVETLDLVVVGAFAGKGDRAGKFGSYLLAAWDEDSDKLKTVTKVGSGFSDEELDLLTERFENMRVGGRPSNVKSEIEPDYWFSPKEVFEINYEEIQRSPSEAHTSGFGLRFPRYMGIREDLDASSADTVSDVKRLFERQEKRS